MHEITDILGRLAREHEQESSDNTYSYYSRYSEPEPEQELDFTER